jgi:Domain of unknown function (DUF4160)
MPRIPGIPGPFWFYFYSFERNEPMHVHVGATGNMPNSGWRPSPLGWNHGFNPRELNEIRRLIVEHEAPIIEAWHEHCGQR